MHVLYVCMCECICVYVHAGCVSVCDFCAHVHSPCHCMQSCEEVKLDLESWCVGCGGTWRD